MNANNDEVICPNCVHQFRAIPVNAQTRIAELEAAIAASEKDAARWQDRAEKAGTAVALFARAIKLGENWSPMCEAMLTQVNSAGSDAAIAKERL